LDGRLREVSLRELFAQAGELRMIACELPTQTFAILRLVLAILHRATGGPAGEATWRDLWRSPGLPCQVIEEYLDAFRDRFDLLHPERPFYQVADLRTAKDEPFGLERIIADVPNGFPYLTTRAGTGMDQISPAEAARWVVHCQAYDPSGIKSGAVGDPRVKGGRGYPIGVGSMGSLGGVYLEGATLRETLLLNLVPVAPGLLRSDDRDLPVWEREPQGSGEEAEATRGPFGVLSLYTWQSRRIRLYGDREGITGAMVANGDKISWQDGQWLEPMSTWGRSASREKALKKVPVYLPRPHDHTRALWRGLETLLPQPLSSSEPAQRLPPLIMQWLARLRINGAVGEDFQVTSRAVSVTYGNQQAVIDEIYGDALTMNVLVVLEDSKLHATVVDSAADAEAAVRALRSLAANLVHAVAGSGTDNGEADRAAAIAYSQLDRMFRTWLARLGPSSVPRAERTTWQQSVRRTVARLGHELIKEAGPAAWVGRVENDRNGKEVHYCSSQAEAWFRSGLTKALPLAVQAPTRKQEVSA
jgi:CRISPR system Cascade subunit CasA